MPAVSVKQRQAAAIAEHHPEQARGAAKEMAESMSKDQLHDFAATSEKGLPEKSEEEKAAFVTSFLNKCASAGTPPESVTRMVYAICRRDSDARDAFESFVKRAFDLSSLPEATKPGPVPTRSAQPTAAPAKPAAPTDDAARTKEVMQKKYADWFLEGFLATPIVPGG